MNCKQGDLAIVIYAGLFPKVLGAIVKCVSFEPYKGISAWRVDPPFWAEKVFVGDVGYEGNWVYDKHLRPIGNPSDDEVDETLLWIGVPNKELIPAKE